MRTRFRLVTAAALAMLAFPAITTGSDPASERYQQLAEDILRELVEFETTALRPDETRQATQAMADRLTAAGMPAEDIHWIHPAPDQYGLVARLRGLGERRPVLAMAHIDVVTADPDAWAFPPFTFGNRDGYYFGRGTQDNKAGVAHLVTNFIRLLDEDYVPNRDLILVLTGDEETDGHVISWLTTEGRALIDAEFALNSDAASGELDEAYAHRAFHVQTSEKVYQTYRLTVTNPGGHSSIPRPDNAINQLARALVRIADYRFPVEIGENSRIMFDRKSRLEHGQRASDMRALTGDTPDPAAAERLSQDPYVNALLRTTCVATQLNAGHAENALPRTASATVNCRILPGTPPQAVEARLRDVVDDEAVQFTSIYDARPSPPSLMPAAFQESIESLVESIWPGVPVVPEMSTGATDGLFVRNAGIPVFGMAGWFMRRSDVRAHGLDEKISIEQFRTGNEFWYRLLKTASQP